MFSLTRRSAADSSFSQPAMRNEAKQKSKPIQRRGLSIGVVSEGILTGLGEEVKAFSICDWRFAIGIWDGGFVSSELSGAGRADNPRSDVMEGVCAGVDGISVTSFGG